MAATAASGFEDPEDHPIPKTSRTCSGAPVRGDDFARRSSAEICAEGNLAKPVSRKEALLRCFGAMHLEFEQRHDRRIVRRGYCGVMTASCGNPLFTMKFRILLLLTALCVASLFSQPAATPHPAAKKTALTKEHRSDLCCRRISV